MQTHCASSFHLDDQAIFSKVPLATHPRSLIKKYDAENAQRLLDVDLRRIVEPCGSTNSDCTKESRSRYVWVGGIKNFGFIDQNI